MPRLPTRRWGEGQLRALADPPGNLLAHAEGLGCARLGLPLLRWKQQRRREAG